MPDLIIKPEATSGNKLILKDQGAVTRLQTEDAGITITAPTIASMANCTFPAGHVIQVEHFVYSGYHNYSEPDSGVATPILKAITPHKNNSKILVFVNVTIHAHSTTNNKGQLALYKDIGGGGFAESERWDLIVKMDSANIGAGVGVVFYDTVTSLSELTYKVYVRNNEANGDIRINDYSVTSGAASSSITLMEIAV